MLHLRIFGEAQVPRWSECSCTRRPGARERREQTRQEGRQWPECRCTRLPAAWGKTQTEGRSPEDTKSTTIPLQDINVKQEPQCAAQQPVRTLTAETSNESQSPRMRLRRKVTPPNPAQVRKVALWKHAYQPNNV